MKKNTMADRKVYVEVKVRLVIRQDEGIETSEVIDEMDCGPQLGRRLRAKPMVPEVAAVVDAYNAIAGDGLKAERGYIVPSKWQELGNTHYELAFRKKQLCLAIYLDADNLFLKTLCSMLAHAFPKATVIWQGRDGLHMKFPKDTEPAVVAEAMKRLIELTSPVISEELIRRATQ